ncbi:MAG: trypsin-like peptidase domain-containing protein [Nitrospirota bacterium]|nr:trypsin-like peptidase domain-containing protein [Nitrospirota bacterium]
MQPAIPPCPACFRQYPERLARTWLTYTWLIWSTVLLLATPSTATLPPVDSQGTALPTLAPMLEQATPAVVGIVTRKRTPQDQPADPLSRWFYNLPQQEAKPENSMGSGVVVDARRGLVLTNHHVVGDASLIEVNFKDGRALSAELVGSDPDTDVAVIRVDTKELAALPMANSEQVRVGDFVVAIGNPFGIGQTVTSGIVSAVGRSGLGIEGYEDFIQTDASINPGNSGGALVNLKGELVGINTAILGPGGGNVGIGFAIPINLARDVMEQLLKYGAVRRGRLGVAGQDLTPALARTLGLESAHGVLIAQVTPGSPAQKAGIRTGDVVVGVAGRPVRRAADLHNRLGLLRVGELAEIEIVRDSRHSTLTFIVSDQWGSRAIGADISPLLAGASLGTASGGGVAILEVTPGSRAWSAGLREGDRILAVNRVPVDGLEALQKLPIQDGRPLLLHMVREGVGPLLAILR